MPRLRAFLPVLVLLIGYAFVFHTRGQAAIKLAKPLTSVLQGLGGYRVQDLKIGDEERRIAGMSDYVARIYYRDSAVAFTTLVSYYERQTQGKTIHSPKNCLPGAGWEIMSGGVAPVTAAGASYSVNRFVLRNGSAVSLAYYWYQGRGRVASNEYQVKWNLLRDAALLGHTEEALVRIVIPVTTARVSTDSAALARAYSNADRLAEQLASQMIVDVRAALPASAGAPAATSTASTARGGRPAGMHGQSEYALAASVRSRTQ